MAFNGRRIELASSNSLAPIDFCFGRIDLASSNFLEVKSRPNMQPGGKGGRTSRRTPGLSHGAVVAHDHRPIRRHDPGQLGQRRECQLRARRQPWPGRGGQRAAMASSPGMEARAEASFEHSGRRRARPAPRSPASAAASLLGGGRPLAHSRPGDTMHTRCL